MTEALIWLAALGLVALLFGSLIYEQGKRARRSDEEYQQQVKEEPGMLGRGLMALDQIAFRPQAKAALEYQQDKQRGQTPDQQTQGEITPASESD